MKCLYFWSFTVRNVSSASHWADLTVTAGGGYFFHHSSDQIRWQFFLASPHLDSGAYRKRSVMCCWSRRLTQNRTDWTRLFPGVNQRTLVITLHILPVGSWSFTNREVRTQFPNSTNVCVACWTSTEGDWRSLCRVWRHLVAECVKNHNLHFILDATTRCVSFNVDFIYTENKYWLIYTVKSQISLYKLYFIESLKLSGCRQFYLYSV